MIERKDGVKIYLYGIIDSNVHIAKPITGLEAKIVYNLSYSDIGAVISEFGGQIEDVVRHEEVVEGLMENFTVLPVRFSTVFNQETAVLEMLKEYYQDFKKKLDRLRNKMEFGIRVIWNGETIKNRIIEASKRCHTDTVLPDKSPANSFVKEKFAKYKIDREFAEEADRCIALLDDFFSRFAAEKKLEKLKSDNLLLNAYYLVEKEKQGDFKDAFERAKKAGGDLKYLFSGPWPAYNFINLNKEPYRLKDCEGLKLPDKQTGNYDLSAKRTV